MAEIFLKYIKYLNYNRTHIIGFKHVKVKILVRLGA